MEAKFVRRLESMVRIQQKRWDRLRSIRRKDGKNLASRRQRIPAAQPNDQLELLSRVRRLAPALVVFALVVFALLLLPIGERPVFRHLFAAISDSPARPTFTQKPQSPRLFATAPPSILGLVDTTVTNQSSPRNTQPAYGLKNAPINTDAPILTPNRITGFVYMDSNEDGSRSVGELAIEGVAIELHNASGLLIATETTTEGGSYEFSVSGGSYTLREIQPSDYLDGEESAGTNRATIVADDQIAVSVSREEQSGQNNFGERQLSSISGKVYLDANDDGTATNEELPLESVTIELLDSTGAVVSRTNSLADGSYTFRSLNPGFYTVHEIQPEGYLDGLETPGAGNVKRESSSITTADDRIAVALEPVGQSSGNNFGDRPGSITGLILRNTSRLAFARANDPEIAGVTVQLINNTRSVIASTATDELGAYRFPNLAAGEYSIQPFIPNSADQPGPEAVLTRDLIAVNLAPGQISEQNNFAKPTGAIGGVIKGSSSNLQPIGVTNVTVQLRNPAGAVVAKTTVGQNAEYSFTGLPTGKYIVEQTRTGDSQNGEEATENPTIPFANDKLIVWVNSVPTVVSGANNSGQEGRNSSIYGTVFTDNITPNGYQEASFGSSPESGIAGVTVTLLDAGGKSIDTTTTDVHGSYSFVALSEGTYSVVETQPGGYVDGIDRIGNGDPSNLPDKHRNLFLPGNSYLASVNFGEQSPSANSGQLSGQIFADLDENGNLAGDDGPIPSVAIMVYNSKGTYVSGTVADAKGNYSITGLSPDRYTVVKTRTALFGDSKQAMVRQTASPEPADQLLVTVTANGNSMGNNFGELMSPRPISISSDPNAKVNVPRATPVSIVSSLSNPLNFGGHSWSIKSSITAVGPGPNLFATKNATVDDAGNLHLQITNDNGIWYSAEIINTSSFGYGTYRWTAITDLSDLDRNVVLGLFTWNNSPSYANREIDIEVAKWGSTTDTTKAQFVVQPSEAPNHLRRYTQPPGGPSTLQFTWAPGRIDYEVRVGNVLVDSWSYVGSDVPVPGGETARINLWQHQGLPPVNGRPVEIVFTDFDYCTPFGACQ
jgi:SdrD B-like domain